MKVKELIDTLNKYDKDIEVLVASDEEWNTLFQEIRIDEFDKKAIVVFGLSGSDIYD